MLSGFLRHFSIDMKFLKLIWLLRARCYGGSMAQIFLLDSGVNVRRGTRVLKSHTSILSFGLILYIILQIICWIVIVTVGPCIENFISIGIDKPLASFLRWWVIILVTTVLILARIVIVLVLLHVSVVRLHSRSEVCRMHVSICTTNCVPHRVLLWLFNFVRHRIMWLTTSWPSALHRALICHYMSQPCAGAIRSRRVHLVSLSTAWMIHHGHCVLILVGAALKHLLL